MVFEAFEALSELMGRAGERGTKIASAQSMATLSRVATSHFREVCHYFFPVQPGNNFFVVGTYSARSSE